jgi:hypothetical protein
VLRNPAEPEGRVYIDAPDAARLLDFACAVYGVLLRCLVQSFGRSGPSATDDQKTLVSAAIGLMHVLADASTALARLPASLEREGVNAGMSFTMLRGVEPLLPGPVERRLLAERARDLVAADVNIGTPARQALTQTVDVLVQWESATTSVGLGS